MPLLITHLFLTIMCFDFLRDLTKRIRIRNKHLVLLGLSGALPDLDILLVPILGWHYHKLLTHNLLAVLVFLSAMSVLFFLKTDYSFRSLFLLSAVAYMGHVVLDYFLRAVPLFYPWDTGAYGSQILGSPTEYLTFTLFDTSAYAFMFLYFLLTGFKTFRYKFDLPPTRKWFEVEVEKGESKPIRLTTGFFLKRKFNCRLSAQFAQEGVEGKGVNIFLSHATDPSHLHYASTFYEKQPEYAHDANLIINVREVSNKSVKMEMLPANYTVLVELIEELTRRKFFEFEKQNRVK